MTKVRVVCAHDCPDMCSLVAEVEEGRVVRLQGDPDEAYTAGFACAKVTRDMETLHSPDRLRTPLRRTGPKGSGQFAPITWDAALAEITDRWKAIIAESGPEAILGYAYSAHQGHMNRRLVGGLFHALGTSRLQAGTVCDTCCETAWDMTCGPVGGTDPESVVHSDLVIAWGCDLMAVNVHFWALLEKVRKSGVQLVVIDPRRSQTAARADWHLPIRIGTDAALACGIAHILERDGLLDRDYIAARTLGFDRWSAEVLPNFPPERVAEITGLAVADVERLAAMYGAAKASLIRLGEGMTRLAKGGQALRAVATLPALTGAYGREGGGALLLAAGSMDFQFGGQALGAGLGADGQPSGARRGAGGDARPAAARPVHRGEQPGGHQPGCEPAAACAVPRGFVHRRARPVPDRHGALCGHRAAGHDLSGNRGFLSLLRHLPDAIRPGGGAAPA
jgi:anaerobic selenocysteine-containing dehydrogenase